MKISASLYSNQSKNIAQKMEELLQYNLDMVHIDCNDDIDVFDDIAYINANASMPIDLHIISDQLDKFVPLIKKNKIAYVCFQYENISELDIEKWLHNSGLASTTVQLGLAFVNTTDLEKFAPLKHCFDFAMLMTTTPGKSGGTFDASNFKRIHEFKKMYPKHDLQVDGGVNGEVSFIVRNLGVTRAVSGSYLMNAPDFGHALMQLKYKQVHSNFSVNDIMLPLGETPTVSCDATLLEALNTIETYRLGFVAVIDTTNALKGIISNADVRRAWAKALSNNINIPATITPLINTTPLCIESESTVTQMLDFVKKLTFPVLFLPVVDQQNKLIGTIAFNNLIKGEG